jgi:hypothetical protein
VSNITPRGLLAAAPALCGAALYSFGFANAATASFALSLAQSGFLWRRRLWPFAIAVVVCGAGLFAGSIGLAIGFAVDRLTFEANEPPADLIGSIYWWSLFLGLLLTAAGLARALWPSRWAFVPPLAFLSFVLVLVPALAYFAYTTVAFWMILNFVVVGIALLRLHR